MKEGSLDKGRQEAGFSCSPACVGGREHRANLYPTILVIKKGSTIKLRPSYCPASLGGVDLACTYRPKDICRGLFLKTKLRMERNVPHGGRYFLQSHDRHVSVWLVIDSAHIHEPIRLGQGI